LIVKLNENLLFFFWKVISFNDKCPENLT
jgi:hypothetical protein